jgi:hypothetical protein
MASMPDVRDRPCAPPRDPERRPLRSSVRLAGALGALAWLGWAPSVAEAQTLLGASQVAPIEQRMALAVGPTRTTLWANLRFSADPGEVAFVVPLPAGASVDQASRAFLESLEEATAPRILAPDGGPQSCPGDPPLAPVVAGDLAPTSTLAPLELLVLDDVVAVASWADGRGLVVPASVEAALSLQPAARFLVARFASVGSSAITPTFRVSTPAGAARFPLVLSHATTEDLRVLLFTIGEGRAELGPTPVALGVSPLRIELEPPGSNYEQLVAQALAAPGTYLVEASSHAALRDSLPVGNGTIRGVASSYFERAAAYGDALGQPGTCASQAAVVLGQSAFVGSACPRGDLAVVPGGATCSGDLVEPGEVSPELLRCGGIADDLALALGDLEPSEAWLTRAVQIVGANGTGSDRTIGFVGGPRIDPVLVATQVDVSGCEGEGGAGPVGPSGSGPSGSTGAGVGSGAGEPNFVEVPLRSYEGCGCSGTWVTIDYLVVDASEESPPDAYYTDDGGCSADSSESYESDSFSEEPTAESCTSDTTGTYETDSSESGETYDSSGDCAGDTSDGSSESGTADDCSSDTSSDSGDGCGSDTSTDSGDDCAISTRPGRGKGRFRLSVATYLLLLGVVPMRRWSKRRRKSL